MRTTLALAALSSVVLVNAQNPPAATPSNAVIISGDASYDGPVIKGTTGKLGNAQVITNNPLGAQYKATFSDSKTYVRGSLTAQTGPGGKGVQFSISVSGFPSANAGPFCTSRITSFGLKVAMLTVGPLNSVPHPSEARPCRWQLYRDRRPLGSVPAWRHSSMRFQRSGNLPGW